MTTAAADQDMVFVHASAALQSGDEDRLSAFLDRSALSVVYTYTVQAAHPEWEGLAPTQLVQRAWLERSSANAGDAAATHRALEVLVADERTLNELRSLPSNNDDKKEETADQDVTFAAVLASSQDLDDFSEELAEVLAQDDLDRDMDHPDRAQLCSRKLEVHCEALKQQRRPGCFDCFWAPASTAKRARQRLVDAEGRHTMVKLYSARATLRGADELFSAASVNDPDSTFNLPEEDLADGIFRGDSDIGVGEDEEGEWNDDDLHVEEEEDDNDEDAGSEGGAGEDEDFDDGIEVEDGRLYLTR
ncbi:hypothetical protein OC834_003330 [Tilletia horrida]|nr:hypothetical protein OC834_003330 [Tilletia horrida]